MDVQADQRLCNFNTKNDRCGQYSVIMLNMMELYNK